MKRIKLLALAVAIVLVCLMVPSCAEVVTYENVRFAAIYQVPTEVENEDGEIEIKFEEEVLVDVIATDITGSSDGTTTVLDAVIQILESNGIRHKVEDEASISSIKGKSEKSQGGYFYVWEYTINGLKPEGRASEIPLESNMKIVYTYTGAKDKTASSTETEAE